MKKMVNTKKTLKPITEPVKQTRKVEKDLLPSAPSFRQLPVENRHEIEHDDTEIDP